MLKIVDGNGRSMRHPQFDDSSAVALLGSHGDGFRVLGHDLGHGHTEVTASREVVWTEADWSPAYMQDVLDVIRTAWAEADPAEVAAKHRERAARGARTRVRRLCKAMGADTLLTLTYAANMTDLAQCKADLKEFNRRMLRVLPGFQAVACFERQKRGAWHVHIATAGIPTVLPVKGGGDFRSFNVIRAIWRSVTKGNGGNVDVARRRFHSRKTSAEIASYIAKYIGKSFLDPEITSGVNRWTKFGKCEVPPPINLGRCASLLEALDSCFQLLGRADKVCRIALDKWKDWFFLEAERKPGRQLMLN